MGFPPRASRQCTAIRAKLPQRPALLSPLPCCPPFLHTAKPSHFTLHGATLFFITLLQCTPHTTTSKNVAVFTLQYVRPRVHYMSGWKFITRLGSGTAPTPACWCIPNIFLHVQIERAVSVSDTGLIQALDTVAMHVHAAFRPVEWRL